MSAGRSSTTGHRRRRRTPEVAEREIVGAAEALLRERPFRELTVDEVMRRTELSRPSFYVNVRDRHDLVLRVVERLGAGLYAMSERGYAWTGGGREVAGEAIEGVVGVFANMGRFCARWRDAPRGRARDCDGARVEMERCLQLSLGRPPGTPPDTV